MRIVISLAFLLVVLGTVAPAGAQLRETALEQRAPAKLYTTNSSGFMLNKLFDPAHFRMGQSIEFSSSSFGGQTSSLGMFTNSMMWQFNQKLAARVDVSVAYSPNAASYSDVSGNEVGNAQVFVRNAEVAYRPSENVQLHLSFRQSPYGSYASPYGYYRSPYSSSMNRFNVSYNSPNDLFWNDSAR